MLSFAFRVKPYPAEAKSKLELSCTFRVNQK